jgi:Sel1 repeat
VLDFLVFAGSLVLWGFVCILGHVQAYRTARRKGYKPPAALLFILSGWALGISATILRRPANSTSYQFFIDFFWLPLLFAAVATAILLFIAPRRQLRVFGERRVRFPFIRAGQVLIAFGGLVCAIAVFLWATGKRELSLVVNALTLTFAFLVPTGFYLMRRGRRLQTTGSFDQLLVQDSRAPVLYLRAFNQESQFFLIGLKSEYGAYAKSWHARVSKDEQKIGITFEQYFSDAVKQKIGPFVALGSPEDYLAPEGAARMYAKDADWKEKFEDLAQRCACILVEVGRSSNLRWEFEQLRRQSLQQKLFIVTRHSTEGSSFGWAFWNLLWRMKGIRKVTWKEFVKDIGILGYQLEFEDPGAGSVLTFDSEGRGILLTAGADRPDEFVEPIRAWLASREKVGQFAPLSCRSCGRTFYVAGTSDQIQRRRLCQECNEGLTPRERVWVRIAPSVYFIFVVFSMIAVPVAFLMWLPEGTWLSRHAEWTVWPIVLPTIGVEIAAYILVARQFYRRVARRVVGRFRKLAEAGDSIAMFQLSCMYSEGRKGLTKDEVRAAAWRRRAAEAGDAYGMCNLGAMYREGKGGLSKDSVQAAYWYRKAAELGDAGAINNLGTMYQHGEGGLPKDSELALSCYKRAASLGCEAAERNIQRVLKSSSATRKS